MDQAQQLRNVIKGRNCVITGNARIITVTSGKVESESRIYL